jgi:hypothetical protein
MRLSDVLSPNSLDKKVTSKQFPEIVNRTLETMFPAEPSQFMARAPHGYHDPAVIARDLASVAD